VDDVSTDGRLTLVLDTHYGSSSGQARWRVYIIQSNTEHKITGQPTKYRIYNNNGYMSYRDQTRPTTAVFITIVRALIQITEKVG
jgi:hypothetical protein